jgi:uncharacterized Rossmann fold enzyme
MLIFNPAFMNFNDWNKYYKRIVADFGYKKDSDEKSALLLSNLISRKEMVSEQILSRILKNKEITIVGGHLPSVKNYLNKESLQHPIIAADSSISILLNKHIIPDIIVTDLDGNVKDILRANDIGAIAVIHAHSDNKLALKRYLPQFKGKIICTTQTRPLKYVYNFGGFTDGDRCVFLASHFKARSINLIGFEFSKPYGEKTSANREMKRKKLEWARKLIDIVQKQGVPIYFKAL